MPRPQGTGTQKGYRVGGAQVANAGKGTTLQSAAILTLRATPVQVLPAPTTGYAYVITGVHVTKTAGIAYTVGTDNAITLRYTNASGQQLVAIPATGVLDQAGSTDYNAFPSSITGTTITALPGYVNPINAPIVASMSGAAEVTGGTGKVRMTVRYYIVRTPLPVD